MMSSTKIFMGGGTRQSSIELLRVLAMLAIVAGHSIVHAGQDHPAITGNGLFAVALTQGSRIGVDLFIFISGYFSVGRQANTRKLFLQYVQIWTYSVLIGFGLALTGNRGIGVKEAVRLMMPVSSSQYWFATSYFLIMLASPLLQAGIARIDQKAFRRLLLIFLVLWCVIPTAYIASPGMNELTWLVYVWLLAAYLRKYPLNVLERIRAWHGVLRLALIVAATLVTYILGQNSVFLRENAMYMYAEMNKLPAILCMLLLFFGFKNWRLPVNRVINLLAPLTFGVYLFHDHPGIRKYLWSDALTVSIDDPYFAVKKMGAVLAVFAVGMLFEFLRKAITEKIEQKTGLAEKFQWI